MFSFTESKVTNKTFFYLLSVINDKEKQEILKFKGTVHQKIQILSLFAHNYPETLQLLSEMSKKSRISSHLKEMLTPN